MIETEEKLTEQQVNDVLNAWNFLEFSNSYRSAYNRTYLTPDSVNQQMKNINMNPLSTTLEKIEDALKNPKDSETLLKGYSESLECQNMYYKRLLRYFPDMASFNLTFDTINIEKDSDYSSKAFKDDLKILDDFCNKFNFKELFGFVMQQLLRQGVYYCVLRNDGDKYCLQELPSDFCKITGRFSDGLLFDFNMNWFIGNYGVDINMYPKIFKKMYNDVFSKANSRAYNPNKGLSYRNSVFSYWHQTSPNDGFWCFKLNPEIATIVPYFSPLFPDISLQPTIRNLQTDKYFIEASKLLVGIVGFNKDAKSGQVANQINISPDMLGKFLGVARQGLSKQIGLTALPMESIESVEFDTSNTNMSIDSAQNIASQGVASADIMLSNNKLNSNQSKLASAVDANIVLSLYPMFADFVEFFVNKMTKKFKFKIKFNDVELPDYKNERLTRFKDFAAMGMVDVQQAARVFNMNAFEFSRSLSLSKTFGIENKLISLVEKMSGQNKTENSPKTIGIKKRGRPAILSPDNDNTEASQARGSNELKD